MHRDSGRVVAHCATPFLPETGSWIYNQIRWLQRWQPIVLTQEWRNRDQFPVPRLRTAETLSLTRTLANRAVRKLTGEYPFYGHLLEEEGARVIHAHFGYQGCRCLRAQRSSGLPMITSFYGADANSYARQPYWQRRYRQLFDRGAFFLVEGAAMAQRLQDIGCPEDRMRIHHLGIELPEAIRELPDPEREVRVLMCGAFRPKKGFPAGIRALGRVAEGVPNLRLTLIGDGPERPRVEEALRDSGLSARVDRLGFVPHAEVINQLSCSHILLVPSRTAEDGDSEGGAPVILLDAQSLGVPVVATRHADIPEYVVDGESGLLAEEGDETDLTRRLEEMLTRPQDWIKMGRRGRRHVAEEYEASSQCRGLEEIYDGVS
ncbi:MAG: glycosyltransferase [Candidatus Latescibacterota bacterium]|nr:glycosyltransferase [Candidatus Latescibacterota bacterium]